MAEFDPYKAGEESRKKRMADMIAPNAYTAKTKSEQSSIDRRAKMIELLQGQADAPIERFSYGGIEAVTPPSAYLAKILSSAMAGYQSGKARQEQEALDKYKEQAQTQDMGTMIEMLKKGGTVPTDVSSVYDTSFIKDPARRAQQDASLAEPVMPQQPTYTGGMPKVTVSTGKPIVPVNEIQARKYNFRTPEGQMELLRQTAAEKQSRAEMLAGQFANQALLDKEERTFKAAIEAARLRQKNREEENLLKNQQDVDAAAILAKDNAAKAEKAALDKVEAIKNRPLSPQSQAEIFKSDEIVESAKNAKSILDSIITKNPETGMSQNDLAYNTSMPTIRAGIARVLPFSTKATDASVDLENKVLGQALESLRATFAGSPTEGERAILVQLQGSLSQTPNQREKIYKRASDLANKRIKFNQEKAKQLRNKTYFEPISSDDEWEDVR